MERSPQLKLSSLFITCDRKQGLFYERAGPPTWPIEGSTIQGDMIVPLLGIVTLGR